MIGVGPVGTGPNTPDPPPSAHGWVNLALAASLVALYALGLLVVSDFPTSGPPCGSPPQCPPYGPTSPSPLALTGFLVLVLSIFLLGLAAVACLRPGQRRPLSRIVLPAAAVWIGLSSFSVLLVAEGFYLIVAIAWLLLGLGLGAQGAFQAFENGRAASGGPSPGPPRSSGPVVL